MKLEDVQREQPDIDITLHVDQQGNVFTAEDIKRVKSQTSRHGQSPTQPTPSSAITSDNAPCQSQHSLQRPLPPAPNGECSDNTETTLNAGDPLNQRGRPENVIFSKIPPTPDRAVPPIPAISPNRGLSETPIQNATPPTTTPPPIGKGKQNATTSKHTPFPSIYNSKFDTPLPRSQNVLALKFTYAHCALTRARLPLRMHSNVYDFVYLTHPLNSSGPPPGPPPGLGPALEGGVTQGTEQGQGGRSGLGRFGHLRGRGRIVFEQEEEEGEEGESESESDDSSEWWSSDDEWDADDDDVEDDDENEIDNMDLYED